MGEIDRNLTNRIRMVDLSSLADSKLYYIEVADNMSNNHTDIKEVGLIDRTEWGSVIDPHPSDEVAYISGSSPITLTFPGLKKNQKHFMIHTRTRMHSSGFLCFEKISEHSIVNESDTTGCFDGSLFRSVIMI